MRSNIDFIHDPVQSHDKIRLKINESLLTQCKFQKPHFVNTFIWTILGYISFTDSDEFDPDENIKSFVSSYTYHTPRVSRRGRRDGWKCVTNKLYSHYEEHKNTNKERGIEELTNGIMEFIEEIATKKEDNPYVSEFHGEMQFI